MFTDIYVRSYLDASPAIRKYRPKRRIIAKPPALTSDDLLVQSFIANENTVPYFQ